MRCVLDTNIVLTQLIDASISPPHVAGEYAVSVITEAELLQLPGLSEIEQFRIEDILSVCTIIPITSLIARKAAALGRTRRGKLPDLLIAATAILYDVPLVTKNIRDFKNIPQLKVIEKIT